jgi:MYXO-CTERM domain-containing protein
MPASLRIEVLTEEMAPEVITDNRAQVTAIIGDVVEDRSTDRNSGSGGGCDTTGSAPLSAGATLLLAAAGIGLAARRRRRD